MVYTKSFSTAREVAKITLPPVHSTILTYRHDEQQYIGYNIMKHSRMILSDILFILSH